MRVRRGKRARLLDEGREPYPVGVPRTHTLTQVRAAYGHLATAEETQDLVGVAGRVVFIRNTGKLAFATLQEGDGTRLQAMLSLAEVGERSLVDWKADVDLGDFVFVHGRVISSKRGELSVLADEWTMASKALRPLPTMHSQLSEEARVRQRYADLIVRQEARDMVRNRAAIVRAVRDTLHSRGFIEIETPVLQLVHGGATARPFPTHLNAFDIKMSLRIALELYLKRAVVGGVEKVFEMGRIFRNEGVDSTHSPEFTMLEAYEAFGDQHTMAHLMQGIVLAAADAFGSRVIDTPAGQIQLDAEWRWLPVYQGLSEAVCEEITPETDVKTLRAIAARRDVPVNRRLGGREAGGRAIWGDRRADPDTADLRLRLSTVGPAAGPTAPKRPQAHRGLGPHHWWHRTRYGLLGADRPGDPAGSAHRAVPAGCCGRR